MLEVFDRDGGMVCSTEEHVHVRVYASGLAEGDFFSGPCSPRLSKFFTSYSRRSVQLDDGQMLQLKSALDQPELSAVRDSYPAYMIGIDSGVFETIRFKIDGQHKSVALVNPNPTHPQNKANYPASLINLLLEIGQVRQRLEAGGT